MKTKKKAAKKKPNRSKMPKFLPIDEEMKELSAMLETELSAWPGISKKPMFGFQGLYRNGAIFAALPRSRAINSPRSIMIKFGSASIANAAKKDFRVGTVSGMGGGTWITFDLPEASATKDALALLGRAYEAAKN